MDLTNCTSLFYFFFGRRQRVGIIYIYNIIYFKVTLANSFLGHTPTVQLFSPEREKK